MLILFFRSSSVMYSGHIMRKRGTTTTDVLAETKTEMSQYCIEKANNGCQQDNNANVYDV